MESIPVNLYYWKPNAEDKKLGLKILTAIEAIVAQSISDIALEPHECVVNVEEVRPLCEFNIVFGDMAVGQLPDGSRWYDLGNINNLHRSSNKPAVRDKAFAIMCGLADDMLSSLRERQTQTEVHVETPDGTTVGQIGTDIVVTEAEAEYLSQLKELLKGSKVVVTKGDIKIEVS